MESFLANHATEIAALILALVGIGLAWTKGRVAELIAQYIHGSKFRAAMYWFNECVHACVLEATQTKVEALKKALADSKLTSEEYEACLKEVKRAVVNKVVELVYVKVADVFGWEKPVQALTLVNAKVEAEIRDSRGA